MEVSLREQLRSFIKDEVEVTRLVQKYHELCQSCSSWRIGGFIRLVKLLDEKGLRYG